MANTTFTAAPGLDPANSTLLPYIPVFLLAPLLYYLFHKPPLHPSAPALVSDHWPIIGSSAFFSDRWGFFERSAKRSKTGNFSFYAGQWPIIGLSGEAARRTFFEAKPSVLGFSEGYAALLGGTPPPKEGSNDAVAYDQDGTDESRALFFRRLPVLLKGDRLEAMLPKLIDDVRTAFEDVKASPNRATDPFESVYRKMVYRMTMRIVACEEIADDAPLLEKTLRLFEKIEDSATPAMVMFPWLPTLGKFKRNYYGAQLGMIFKGIIDARQKDGLRKEDALQYLLDCGDSLSDVLTFVIGALYAGQLNSGVNAAYILLHLVQNQEWLAKVQDEILTTAQKHSPDPSAPLIDQLAYMPYSAWENLPLTLTCLRETIRLYIPGSTFRQNVSAHALPIAPRKNAAQNEPVETIPPGAYVALHVADMHSNPAIYPSPATWDPARFMPERQEDKKEAHAFIGWGSGRHPCLGKRFAELENNIIVGVFCAVIQGEKVRLAGPNGEVRTGLPERDLGLFSAKRPEVRTWLKWE